jgi:hypothetical protein
MIEIQTKDAVLDEMPSAPLFSIDGVEYSARTEFRPNEALWYMNLLVRKGFNFACDWALRTSLGREGHAALIACETMTQQQMEEIVTEVLRPIVGALDGPKG